MHARTEDQGAAEAVVHLQVKGAQGEKEPGASPLSSPQQLLQELQAVLRNCIPALVHLREPSSITGLHHFCLKAFAGLDTLLQGYGMSTGASAPLISAMPQLFSTVCVYEGLDWIGLYSLQGLLFWSRPAQHAIEQL